MLKKIFLSSLLFLSLFGIIYPNKKESAKLFDYCNSLEISLKRRDNLSKGVKLITNDLLSFGLSKSKGSLLNNAIDQYKKSKSFLILTLIPNQLYCLLGYWIEDVNPGMFEAIILEKGKQKINKFKDMENELDEFLRDPKSKYKNFKKDFDSFFK